jgi:hypothetical protein
MTPLCGGRIKKMRKIFKLSSVISVILVFGCSKSGNRDSHDSPAPTPLSPKQSDKDESKSENKEPEVPIESDKETTEKKNDKDNDKDKAKSVEESPAPASPVPFPQATDATPPQPQPSVPPPAAPPAEIPGAHSESKKYSADQFLVLDPKLSGKSEFLSQDDFLWDFRGVFDVEALDYLKKLSIRTGGFVTFSPRPNSFAESVDAVLDIILKDRGTAGNDVVLIIDTTNSMTNDIQNLKEKKDEILQKLKDKSNHPDLKLSLIAYRDKNNSYMAKIVRDFTTSARSFGGAIDELNAGEGNKDIPEAILDALDLADTKLSWRADTNKSVILASDAPGFPVSYSNQTVEQILERYSQKNHQIAIYSILAGSLE